jgi:hypothetical protein
MCNNKMRIIYNTQFMLVAIGTSFEDVNRLPTTQVAAWLHARTLCCQILEHFLTHCDNRLRFSQNVGAIHGAGTVTISRTRNFLAHTPGGKIQAVMLNACKSDFVRIVNTA